MSDGREHGGGLPDEEFARLIESVSTMAPLLKGFLSVGAPPKPPEFEGHGERGAPHACARREALLLSLKPFLSPSRCEAVDYLIRLARVGDAIRALQ